MKNGKLVVTDSEGLIQDVWNTTDCFDENEWKTVINNMVDNLQHVYRFIDGCPIDDSVQYVLGDTINLLKSIDVEVTL